MSPDEEQRDFDKIVRLMRKHGWAKVCRLNGRQDCPPYVVPFSHPQVHVEIMRSQMSAAMFWQGLKDDAARKRNKDNFTAPEKPPPVGCRCG